MTDASLLFLCLHMDDKKQRYETDYHYDHCSYIRYGGIRPVLPEVPLREALARPVEQWDGVLVNDFEHTVFAKYPALEAIKRSLYDSGAVYASMSGSGSALFAIYKK